MTPEQASEFYAEHFGKLFFPSLVAYMSQGPVMALLLAREKAVPYWRELIGPTNAIIARSTHPDRCSMTFELFLSLAAKSSLPLTLSVPFSCTCRVYLQEQFLLCKILSN